MQSDKASEENAITLRSGRLMRSRPRLNGHRRPPPRRGVRTVSHESKNVTATEIAAAATASVATQMAGMFESFLTQLRTDLQELKLSGRPGLSSLDSPNNGDALAGREVGRAEGPDAPKPKSTPHGHETSYIISPGVKTESSQAQSTAVIRADEWIDSVTSSSEQGTTNTGHCH
ncbi:hypothetical protein TTRE_0000649601, partial [Trichuris trichiura]